MNVYVVSTYPAVRAGLTAVIREQPGWSVVGDASLSGVLAANRETALPSVPPSRAVDVVLADLDGAEDAGNVEALSQALRPTRGLVLLLQAGSASGRGDGGAAARAVIELMQDADEAGLALSVLRRDASVAEIVAALGAAGHGLVALDRLLAADLVRPRERVASPAAETTVVAGEPLTAREIEVLQLIAQGLPNKTIALRLHISEHTAKFHVSSILMKLGAGSRTEAVTLAARQGLLIL